MQHVLAHGPPLHAENAYYVIRRYDSLAQREQMEDTYYASDDWRKGPQERILALIESYVDVVLELDEVTVEGLRNQSKTQMIYFPTWIPSTNPRCAPGYWHEKV
jgi:hypothetical protein